MIDSATWTGRTWQWRWIFNRAGILLIKESRYDRMAMARPCYGIVHANAEFQEPKVIIVYWNYLRKHWIYDRNKQ